MRVLAILLSVLCMTNSHADTINVPGEFATIGAAIEAAQDGDEILVAPGVYTESQSSVAKSLTIRSVGGPGVTTVRPDGGGRVFSFSQHISGSSTFEGFTVTRSAVHPGGGLWVNTDMSIRNCIFTDCAGSANGGALAIAVGSRPVTVGPPPMFVPTTSTV